MAQTRKKNATSRSLLALLILCVLGVAAWWLYNRNIPKFVRYPQFGIDIPYNFSVHGIDVSKYQQSIDWAEVKAMNVNNVQIGFAFIKATEGLGNVDGCFRQNWRNAKRAQVIRGAYHFFLATKNGKSQAENFINTVQLETGDLPPVIDVEQAYGVSSDKLKQRVKEFLETVHEYYGVMPIIYTNVDFYNQYLKGDFDTYPLWVAHYLQKDRPRIAREWTFWQHSESGHINGIDHQVDFNVFNGDSAAFIRLLIE